MRPANDERVIIEYVRIHRILDPELLAQDPEPFVDDVHERLTTGESLVGRWWKREWRLGNLEARRDSSGQLVAVSAQFGWFAEAPTVDAPPPYDEAAHQWSTEPAKGREGVLALFTLDASSQIAALTSLAGDVSVPGFCKALTDLLNQAEMSAALEAGGTRAKREWLVDRIDERGTFEAWVEQVARVTTVRATFHRPNPRSSDDIDPVVTYLSELGATTGALVAASPDGLDPYGHQMMRAAIAMQENDFGTITARGEKHDGEVDKFASRDHPTQDVVTPDPEDPLLSPAGLIVRLLRTLANRLEAGLR